MLLASGTKGKRFSLPNARILIHQPWLQGLGGQATDIDIHAKELLRTRERLNQLLASHTGQPLKRIQDDTERDYIMSPDQGKEYGIIDDVIRKRALMSYETPASGVGGCVRLSESIPGKGTTPGEEERRFGSPAMLVL